MAYQNVSVEGGITADGFIMPISVPSSTCKKIYPTVSEILWSFNWELVQKLTSDQRTTILIISPLTYPDRKQCGKKFNNSLILANFMRRTIWNLPRDIFFSFAEDLSVPTNMEFNLRPLIRNSITHSKRKQTIMRSWGHNIYQWMPRKKSSIIMLTNQISHLLLWGISSNKYLVCN